MITLQDMDTLISTAKRNEELPLDRQRKAMLNAYDSLLYRRPEGKNG